MLNLTLSEYSSTFLTLDSTTELRSLVISFQAWVNKPKGSCKSMSLVNGHLLSWSSGYVFGLVSRALICSMLHTHVFNHPCRWCGAHIHQRGTMTIQGLDSRSAWLPRKSSPFLSGQSEISFPDPLYIFQQIREWPSKIHVMLREAFDLSKTVCKFESAAFCHIEWCSSPSMRILKSSPLFKNMSSYETDVHVWRVCQSKRVWPTAQWNLAFGFSSLLLASLLDSSPSSAEQAPKLSFA